MGTHVLGSRRTRQRPGIAMNDTKHDTPINMLPCPRPRSTCSLSTCIPRSRRHGALRWLQPALTFIRSWRDLCRLQAPRNPPEVSPAGLSSLTLHLPGTCKRGKSSHGETSGPFWRRRSGPLRFTLPRRRRSRCGPGAAAPTQAGARPSVLIGGPGSILRRPGRIILHNGLVLDR